MPESISKTLRRLAFAAGLALPAAASAAVHGMVLGTLEILMRTL